MPDIDPFNFFRWGLFIVVSVYCTIITLQQGWSWYVWLMTDDRYITILRQYVIVHGLRLRFKTFWGDVIICALLGVVFILLFWAHKILLNIDRVLS
ncbi:MAG: hypothetical protein JWM57_1979 [Phycisphaerales bacterium]|nr:hypothetical protein [Phycisphaerales bacterium]